MINVTQIRAEAAIAACTLLPALKDLTIEVPAGTFTFERTAYQLEEAEEFVVKPGYDVEGYLVQEDGGGAHLFVFTWPHDGSGIGFDPANYPTLKFLHNLFLVSVPLGTKDLNAVEFKLFHVVEPDPIEKEST